MKRKLQCFLRNTLGKCSVCLVGLLFTGISSATETVSTGDFYPPYVDSRLPDNGLMVPLIKEILNETEDYFDIEMIYEPWARGYELSRAGRHLGTFPYVWDKFRDQSFLYSDPVFDIGSYLFVRDELTERYWDIPMLVEQGWVRVCRPNGYSIEELESRFLGLADFVLISPSDLPDCFRLLQEGRVDIVPIEKMTGEFTLSQHFPEFKIKVFENPIFDASLHFIVSREREDAEKIIRQFNLSLRGFKEKGRMDQMIADFFNRVEVQRLMTAEGDDIK